MRYGLCYTPKFYLYMYNHEQLIFLLKINYKTFMMKCSQQIETNVENGHANSCMGG